MLIGEMRHGMSEGLMLEAMAKMGGRPVDEVRRMHMLEGDVGRLAQSCASRPRRRPGEAALWRRRARMRPPPPTASRTRSRSRPMLAQPARAIADAFAILGPRVAIEHKIDGARVQIHHAPGGVRIFSRRLNEITPSLPEVVEAAKRLGDRHAILDGEVIAVDARAGRSPSRM